MLAVITFMAVTFLVLSQRQRNSVATSVEQAAASHVTDIGTRRAMAEVMAGIKASSNAANFDLRVSTNYISPYGFSTSPSNYTRPANVSYAYPNGTPVTGNDFLRNLANLLYSPRPPVYVKVSGTNDFRFYLDLNRNGIYDTNGWLVERIQSPPYNSPPVLPPVFSYWVGDPEWIGVLERPDYPHSSTNFFIGRYAYIIIPASKTLDLNCIHNYTKANLPASSLLTSMGGYDGFSRNQGVGSWEDNLAAFLVDLNTNLWPYHSGDPKPSGTMPDGRSRYPYTYFPVTSVNYVTGNRGDAFDTALALMRYRYGRQYTAAASLQPVVAIFGARGITGYFNNGGFANDGFDDFGCGPIMTNTVWPLDPDVAGGRLTANSPYPGADNPYHFLTPQDYFNLNKSSLGVAPNAANLSTNLLLAGRLTNSFYDRYTFYRMLQQLGTDSAPEPPTRLNLNYVNVDPWGHIVPNMATNFIAWSLPGGTTPVLLGNGQSYANGGPVQFFTNAAIRMLANAGYTIGLGPTNLLYTNLSNGALSLHIQVWPTNFYTPSVHRLLQVAANIYDATTANPFPSVFRPVFTRSNDIVNGITRTDFYISGYTNSDDASLGGRGPGPTPAMRDLNDPRQRALLGQNLNDMVYGIPVIIGAKKGLPNFNELAMETMIQMTRKLEFRRPTRARRSTRPTRCSCCASRTCSAWRPGIPTRGHTPMICG